MMIARVDGDVVSLEGLWWPALNYGQFRWPERLGSYELEIPRAEFIERLGSAYRQCVLELRADDLIEPDQQFPLKAAGYPSLDVLPDHAAALLETIQTFLWDDLFAEFLPCPPGAGRFMLNSIDAVTARTLMIVVSGRGYHSGPALDGKTEPGANSADK